MEVNVLFSLTPTEAKKLVEFISSDGRSYISTEEQLTILDKMKAQLKDYDKERKFAKKELSNYGIIASLLARQPLIYRHEFSPRSSEPKPEEINWMDSHYSDILDLDDVLDAHLSYRYGYKIKEN